MRASKIVLIPSSLIKLTPLLVHNPFHFNNLLSWVSTIQRNVCRSFFNHGAILFEDLITGEKFIIEAVSHGVHKITLEKYLSYSKDRILYTFDTIEENTDFLLAQVGKKYQFSIWWSHVAYTLSENIFKPNDLEWKELKLSISFRITNPVSYTHLTLPTNREV